MPSDTNTDPQAASSTVTSVGSGSFDLMAELDNWLNPVEFNLNFGDNCEEEQTDPDNESGPLPSTPVACHKSSELATSSELLDNHAPAIVINQEDAQQISSGSSEENLPIQEANDTQAQAVSAVVAAFDAISSSPKRRRILVDCSIPNLPASNLSQVNKRAKINFSEYVPYVPSLLIIYLQLLRGNAENINPTQPELDQLEEGTTCISAGGARSGHEMQGYYERNNSQTLFSPALQPIDFFAPPLDDSYPEKLVVLTIFSILLY